MNCRLCGKDLTGQNGLILFDYNDNTETRLGRKINTILNSSENDETLSNYCCKCCSSKVKICFSLLVEIKASDEVIQQTYKNSVNKQDIKPKTQVFNCQECFANVAGISSFIKHHEYHLIKKTIEGTKKDVTLLSLPLVKTEKKRLRRKGSIESNGEINVKVENEVETIVKNEEEKEEKKFDVDENNINANDVCDDFHLEYLDCPEDVDGFEDFSYEETDEEFSEPDVTSFDSDLSDAGSEDSFVSDSSHNNLVEMVKNELEKSDHEEETGAGIKLEPNEEGKHCCEVCNISFDYKFILLLHLQKNHTAYHEWDTALQAEQFETLESENEVFLKCSYCNNAFHTTDFKNHLLECRENFTADGMAPCQICGKIFSSSDLGKHMEDHKKSDEWACELCGKKFKAKRFLKSHLGEHDESKKKICEICGKKLLPLSFFSHITKHREKRHVCQYCGKAFTYNYSLRIHLKVHESNKKLESKPEKKRDKVFCWLCKKDFNCTIALNKHLKSDHNAEGVEQDSRFPCSQCDKKFADMFSLKAHLKLIHELKDEEISRLKSLPVYRYIECNVCNKIFNSENKIRIHLKQDHGLKPFEMEILKKECEKCGKKFASKQNLIHHINGAHLHIKPMTCDICHEKFAKHSSLIYHKLRHSGEKPFQCEFCHKSYRQRNDVIRHLARHVRDKELTLEEASAVNNSPSRLVIKRRIFLKDSSINYRTIVRKNRRKSEAVDMEPILEEEVNEIQEEQMEFNEDGISDMIYVEEVPVDENHVESPTEVHIMNAKPVYNEETNTIILSNPDNVMNTVKCKYIPSQLKHIPAVIVKKQEQF